MHQFELSDGLCLGVVPENSILVLFNEVSVVAFVAFPQMFLVQGHFFSGGISERSFSGFFHRAL